MYSWTATGVCSHSFGGNGGVVFMAYEHTRHGYRLASITYYDHVNAYSKNNDENHKIFHRRSSFRSFC